MSPIALFRVSSDQGAGTRQKPGARAPNGFTLLELLVAITLLALLFMMLTGAIRFASTTSHSIDNGGPTGDLQIAQGVLRRQLEQALPLVEPNREKDGTVFFKGSSTKIEFIGPPPTRSSNAGLYLNEITVRSSAEGRELSFSWRRLQPDLANLNDSSPAESVQLVEGAFDARFSFFGAPDDEQETQWRDSWDLNKRTPMLTKIELTFQKNDSRIWPPLIVENRINALR